MRAPSAVSTPLGRCVCAGLVAASVAIGAAQQPPQTPAPIQNPPARPTFRTNINAVLVDLRVVDRDGTFVGDLTKDDFRVFEDDQEQAVSTFSLVNIPIAAPTDPGVPRVSPDVVSNASADEGRLYVIVLDDLEEETEQKGEYQALRSVTVRAIARDFVEHHLGTTDRAALITTSGRKNMTVQFTNDRRRLLDAIDRFQGAFGQIVYTCVSPNNPLLPCVVVRDNLHSLMVSLRSLGEWLSAINGRRKAIVLVSDRLGRSMKGDINLDLAAREAHDIQQFLETAARGNVSLYAVDPVGQPTGRPGNIKPLPLDDQAWLDLDRTQSLEVVSEATGGFAATHTNDYAGAFDRVVEENSSYYLLGYTSQNTRQDGKFRKIRVEVRRPAGGTSVGRLADLQVRARSGYAAEKPSATATATAAPDGLPPDLADLVKSPVPVGGLTLSVSATPFRREGSTASVAVIVEARPDARFTGSMEIAIVAADAEGKTRGGERGSLTMNLSPATRDRVAAQGVRMLSSIDLAPGEYHLSVAAGDGRARGSVQYDVTVPDFSKPLAMSGIALASIETGRVPTNGSDTRWKQSLGMPPTTAREFGTADELRVFVEIYDNDQRREHQTNVTMTVRSGSGSTVFAQQQTLPRTAEQTTYQVVTLIPLVDVPPGEYVLTVEAVNSAMSNQPVSRQIPFTIR